MKKIMSVALAVICVLSCFYAVGSAESGSVIENGEFIKCSAEAGGLFRIPDGITGISENAFDGCTGLKNIVFPVGMKSIPSRLFAGCTGMTEITIPDGVTSIEEGAFSDCTGLKKIDIPGRKDGYFIYRSGKRKSNRRSCIRKLSKAYDSKYSQQRKCHRRFSICLLRKS